MLNNIALAIIILGVIAIVAIFRLPDSEKLALSIVSGISGLATGVSIGIAATKKEQ